MFSYFVRSSFEKIATYTFPETRLLIPKILAASNASNLQLWLYILPIHSGRGRKGQTSGGADERTGERTDRSELKAYVNKASVKSRDADQKFP